MSRVKPQPRKSNKKKLQDRPRPSTLWLRRLRRGARPVALLVIGATVVAGLIVAGRGAVHLVLKPLRSTGAVLMADMGFRVRHVVIDGATETPRAVIETAIDVHPGIPIFAVSPAVAAAKLDQLGEVRAAVVERLLPDTIRISLDERKAIAIWQRPAHRFAVIGADGSVISSDGGGTVLQRNPGLLLVVGDGAPEQTKALLDGLDRYPDIRKLVIAAEWIDGLRWNLILKDHAVVRLPARHVDAALAVLEQAETKIALLDRPVQAIDLRLADRLIVLPYPKGAIAADTPPAQAGHS